MLAGNDDFRPSCSEFLTSDKKLQQEPRQPDGSSTSTHNFTKLTKNTRKDKITACDIQHTLLAKDFALPTSLEVERSWQHCPSSELTATILFSLLTTHIRQEGDGETRCSCHKRKLPLIPRTKNESNKTRHSPKNAKARGKLFVATTTRSWFNKVEPNFKTSMHTWCSG